MLFISEKPLSLAVVGEVDQKENWEARMGYFEVYLGTQYVCKSCVLGTPCTGPRAADLIRA